MTDYAQLTVETQDRDLPVVLRFAGRQLAGDGDPTVYETEAGPPVARAGRGAPEPGEPVRRAAEEAEATPRRTTMSIVLICGFPNGTPDWKALDARRCVTHDPNCPWAANNHRSNYVSVLTTDVPAHAERCVHCGGGR
jgi:hypothetical protein